MKTIMVVDDEELVIKSIERLLIKNGYKVIVCRNGSVAIEAIKKENIDLIICDIRMPKLSGIDTIKKIREVRENEKKTIIPEILMTGYSDQAINAEADKLHVSDYLYKPFDLSVFLATVKRSLGDGN